MSDSEAKPKEVAPVQAPGKAKGGGAMMVLGMLIPGILAGAGSFGGAKAAGHAAAAPHVEAAVPAEAKPPGPTIALEPFLVAIMDGSKRSHPMKLTVAVEFVSTAKEDALKPFVPRIRDAILAHMRSLSYEDAVDQEHSAKLRAELLERCKKAGAISAERVLITDLVSQ
jgi:flagellar basal body-associated protein FliL